MYGNNNVKNIGIIFALLFITNSFVGWDETAYYVGDYKTALWEYKISHHREPMLMEQLKAVFKGQCPLSIIQEKCSRSKEPNH